MLIREYAHKIKRKIIRFYNDYFTINNPNKSILPDWLYLKKLYKRRMGRKLNLWHPKTFSEKQNWLKLYDRRPEYTVMVDKYKAREYIAGKVGEQYLVPLLGVWDSAFDIDFDTLPNQFVLKCNHASSVIICRDKKTLDYDGTRRTLAYELANDYSREKREWPYKNIDRKIICEPFMQNTNGDNLVDYKVFCFNGKPRFVMVNSGRFDDSGLRTDMYDMNWKHMDMQDGHYPMAGDVFQKPEFFGELCEIAKKLSHDIPFLRVDFNCWDRKLYFGELTLFHSAGLERFEPEEWDDILGDWLALPRKRRT